MLWIFANSLFALYLYTRAYPLIFVMRDYFYVFTCASDVAAHGASNQAIKLQLLIVT